MLSKLFGLEQTASAFFYNISRQPWYGPGNQFGTPLEAIFFKRAGEKMTSIGSLVFCTDCGNLLPASKGNAMNILKCECCGAENQGISSIGPRHWTFAYFSSLDSAFKTIVTKSKPTDFPSLLREKLSTTQTVERHKVQTEAVIQEACEKCGRKEVRFTSVQLRSADEGATNFYTCDCGHKYVLVPIGSVPCLLISATDGVTTTEKLWKAVARNMFIYSRNYKIPKSTITAELYFWCLILLQNAQDARVCPKTNHFMPPPSP